MPRQKHAGSEQPEPKRAGSRLPARYARFLDRAAQYVLSRACVHEQEHAVGTCVDELAEEGIEQPPVGCTVTESRQNLCAL